MRSNPNESLGREIIDGLGELAETLEAGVPVESKFTVRTVELNLHPREYDADAVRRTRSALQVSQAVFAQILAASVETVESWEQGTRSPSPMACRLLDLINEHRDHWVRVLHDSAGRAESPA